MRVGKDKSQKEKENKSFSMFRRSRKRSEQVTESAWGGGVISGSAIGPGSRRLFADPLLFGRLMFAL